MEKKVSKWLNEGLIDKETAEKLLLDIKEDKEKARKTKVNVTIYTAAVILIGLGVITFIAANDWILKLLNSSDILKIFLMTLITTGSFLGGYKLCYEKKNYPKLGKALIVLSSILIGATYALIGQIYHSNANSSSLMFLWLLSILPVAYLFKSRAVNIISIILLILGVIYLYNELALDSLLIWTIFIPVLSGAILYTAGNVPVVLEKYNDFSLSYKVTGILPIFITLLVLTCSVEHSYNITSPYYTVPLLLLFIINLLNYLFRKEDSLLLKIETIFMCVIIIMLLILLLLPSVSTVAVMILANLLIITIISLGFHYGYKFEQGSIIGATNQMLTIYIAVNYCRWGFSYMDKSLFFILGGVFLLAFGMFLEKRRKSIVNKGKQA